MKALEKDRNRRYASASEMADDVSRFLDQQPIVARPPSAVDRLFKFFRRNRAAVLGTAAVVLVAAVVTWWLVSQANQHAVRVADRTNRVQQAMVDALSSLAVAEASSVGQTGPWETATVKFQRIEDMLAEGTVEPDIGDQAQKLIKQFQDTRVQRDIALVFEDVVMRGATKPNLASWEAMEQEMREFFHENGFDLNQDDPQVIGERIRDHRFATQWAELLELWIGTRGQIQAYGGPQLTTADMQPWADAMYVADDDPVRTGIRKFLYQGPRTPENLEQLVGDPDLSRLSPRALSWLATIYAMVGKDAEFDHVFEVALERYPGDLMLTFDYGYVLSSKQRWQEAARMFHRCLAIRTDIAGIWISLADVLDELKETAAAEKARAKAAALDD